MSNPAIRQQLASLEELRQSEATLKSFYNSSGFLMGIVELPPDDSDILHVYQNPATERFFQRQPGSTTGKWASELRVPHAIIASWIRKYRRSEQLGKSIQFKYRHETENATAWLKVSVAKIEDVPGGRARFSYVGQDISDAVRASSERRQADIRYSRLFDTSPQPMWIFDRETLRIIRVNAAAALHYGYSEDEFLRLTILDIRPPEEIARLKDFLGRKTSSGPTSDGVWRHVRKDGTIIDVELLGHEVEYQGRAARWVMITDVTARVETERRLRQSEERLAAALRAGRLGVFDFDFQTGELNWDETLRDIWGVGDSDTLTPSLFEQGINPEDRPRVLAAIEKARDRPGVHAYVAEYRVRSRRDGAERWVHAEGDVLWSGSLATHFVGTVQDITERKLIEQALREQRGLYKSVTDNASLALFIMDDRQQCVFMNPAAERLTGFSLEELKGRPLHDYIHHTHPDGTPYPLADCPIDQALPKNDRESGEEVFVHKDGHFYDVRFTASPIRNDAGVPVGTVIEVEDITQRKHAERQIMLLMREVNHRSKNMLAVVQAIANQTAHQSSPAEFARSFSDRLQSLAASHDLLVNNNWRGVPLSDLVASQFAHLGELNKRIKAAGPRLELTPSAAQALGLALHELATNALKYGSLSGCGEVTISWDIQAGETFYISWRETGGPLVHAPQKSGFGTRLIREMTRMSLEGAVTIDYLPEGLRWELTAPAGRVLKEDASE